MSYSTRSTAMTFVLSLLCLVIFALAAGCTPAAEEQPEIAASEPKSEALQKAEEARARLSSTEGGKMVLRAIDAHGGLQAWYEAPTSSYAWEYSNVGANLRFKTFLVADNRTRRIYHKFLTLGTPEKAEPFEGRFAWDGEKAWIVPPDVEKINARFWSSTGYYFEQIPFVLADPGLIYEPLPPEDLDQVPHDLVKVSYQNGVGDASDTYVLYLNQDTGMVDAIRYTVTYNRRNQSAENLPETLFIYRDYVEVDGLKVATHFQGYQYLDGKKGEFKNEAWASDISFRRPFDETQLQIPPDARIEPAPGE